MKLPVAEIWFTKGTNDPSINTIGFIADDGYYRDIKHGRMIGMLVMAALLVHGIKIDGGTVGALLSESIYFFK